MSGIKGLKANSFMDFIRSKRCYVKEEKKKKKKKKESGYDFCIIHTHIIQS